MHTIFMIRSPGIYPPPRFLMLLIVLILTVSACTQNAPTPQPTIPTPQEVVAPSPVPTLLVGVERLTALAGGRIIYDDGCLILVGDSTTRVSLVWPVGMRVDVNQDEETITVFNPDGGISRVVLGSQMVHVGGGRAPEGFPQVQPFVNTVEYTGIDDCSPPYWIIASVKPYATPTPSGE